MPKKTINITNFSGGLNNNTSPRDLMDNEFQLLLNLNNEVPGKIKLIGTGGENLTANALNALSSVNYGNGIHNTNFDRNLSGAETVAETEYLFIHDKPNTKVVALDLSGNGHVLESSAFDIDYGSDNALLNMYTIDGVVRVVPHYGSANNQAKTLAYYKYTRTLGTGTTEVIRSVLTTGTYKVVDMFVAPIRGGSSAAPYSYDVDALYNHATPDAGGQNINLFKPEFGSEVYMPRANVLGSINGTEFQYQSMQDWLELELDNYETFSSNAYDVNGDGSMAFIAYFPNNNNDDNDSTITLTQESRYGFWATKVYKNYNTTSEQESNTTFLGIAPQNASSDNIQQKLRFALIGRMGDKAHNYCGIKIYWGLINDFVEGTDRHTGSVSAKYLFCEVNFEEGIRMAGSNDYSAFGVIEANSKNNFMFPTNFFANATDTTGDGKVVTSLSTAEPFIDDDTSVIGRANTGFKTHTVMNRRLYVGNVQYYDKDNNLVTKSDRVLKSRTGKFDVIPETSFIDVEVEDGDSIIRLESLGSKLLQFKKRNLFIINTSRNIEFLEGSYDYKGCEKEYHVTKGEGFVAWFNKYGVFLYTGKRIVDITLGKNGQPKFDDWGEKYYHDNNVIGYIPKTKQIYIRSKQTVNTNSFPANILLYDIKSESWTTGDVGTTNDITNIITRENGDLNWLEVVSSNGKLKKWSNSPTSFTKTGLIMQSKEFDFGTPMVNKNINTIYINCKQTANITLQGFGTKRDNTPLDLTDIGALTNTTSSFKTLKLVLPDTFKNLVSFGIALKSTGAVNAGFEVNDIQIVYRDKVYR